MCAYRVCVLFLVICVTACHVSNKKCHNIENGIGTLDRAREKVNPTSSSDWERILDSFVIDRQLLECLYVRSKGKWDTLYQSLGYQENIMTDTIKLSIAKNISSIQIPLEMNGRITHQEWLVPVNVLIDNNHYNCVIAIVIRGDICGPLNYDINLDENMSIKYATKEQIFKTFLLNKKRWKKFLLNE